MSPVRVHAGNDVHQGEEPSIIVVIFLVIESVPATKACGSLIAGVYASTVFSIRLFDVGIGICQQGNYPGDGQFPCDWTLISFLHCLNSFLT